MTLPGNSTAGRTPPSTNGRVKVEQAISGARDAMQARRRGGVRTRRLLVPVLLALGVIFVLRRFEQSTGG